MSLSLTENLRCLVPIIPVEFRNIQLRPVQSISLRLWLCRNQSLMRWWSVRSNRLFQFSQLKLSTHLTFQRFQFCWYYWNQDESRLFFLLYYFGFRFFRWFFVFYAHRKMLAPFCKFNKYKYAICKVRKRSWKVNLTH